MKILAIAVSVFVWPILFAQVDIPPLGIQTMILASAGLSGIAGTIRCYRKTRDIAAACIDGMLLAAVGVSAACAAVVWLATGQAPQGAEYLIVGVAGFGGFLGVSAWDAFLGDLWKWCTGRVFELINRLFGGTKND